MFVLFFGDVCSALSTIFLLATLGYAVFTKVKHKEIEQWGRRTLILALVGLVLCCFAVMRDDYVEALQGGTGFFPMDSVQIYFAYIGGAINGFAALSSIPVRSQKYRKAMFFVLSGSVVFKAVLIEASRIIMA